MGRLDAAWTTVLVFVGLVLAIIGGVNAGAFWAGYGGQVSGTITNVAEQRPDEGKYQFRYRCFEAGALGRKLAPG